MADDLPVLDGDVIRPQHPPRRPLGDVQGGQLAGDVEPGLAVLLTLEGVEGPGVVAARGRGRDAELGGDVVVRDVLGAQGQDAGAAGRDVSARARTAAHVAPLALRRRR